MAGLSFLQPIVRRSAAKVKNYLPSSFKDALALDQGATLSRSTQESDGTRDFGGFDLQG